MNQSQQILEMRQFQRVLCTVEDYIERNQKYNLNSKYMDSQTKKEFLLRLPDDRFIRK